MADDKGTLYTKEMRLCMAEMGLQRSEYDPCPKLGDRRNGFIRGWLAAIAFHNNGKCCEHKHAASFLQQDINTLHDMASDTMDVERALCSLRVKINDRLNTKLGGVVSEAIFLATVLRRVEHMLTKVGI